MIHIFLTVTFDGLQLVTPVSVQFLTFCAVYDTCHFPTQIELNID